MSNLSDLLPTGGGQNAVDFVASGTLGSGQTVILNNDGTVSAVANTTTTQAAGAPVVNASSYSFIISSAYAINAQRVVVIYRDNGNANYATYVLGTVSGTSISFGSPVVFSSENIGDLRCVYDPNAEKVVITYTNYSNSQYGTAVVGAVSSTSISFGTPVVFESAATTGNATTYDTTTQQIIIAYSGSAGNSLYGTAVVGAVSGTSISFGTPVVFENASSSNISIAYDSANGKVFIAYRDNGVAPSAGTAIIGTVSGTSISFGTPVVFVTDFNYTLSVYDSAAQKIVVVYTTNSSGSLAKVGTITGTSVAFGSAIALPNTNFSYNTFGLENAAIVYDSNASKIVITAPDGNDGQKGKLTVGTVTGSSISFGSVVTFETGGTNYYGTSFDSILNKVVINYSDAGNSGYGTSVVFQNDSVDTNLTASNFIGITAETIANTATGPVNVLGGINEAQSGLTIGSDYYAQADGSIATTVSDVKIGQAISATTINMMDLT